MVIKNFYKSVSMVENDIFIDGGYLYSKKTLNQNMVLKSIKQKVVNDIFLGCRVARNSCFEKLINAFLI